jgi:hypothetical protein
MTTTRTKSIPAIESNRIDVRYIGRDGSVAPWRSWSLPCLPLMSDRSRSPGEEGDADQDSPGKQSYVYIYIYAGTLSPRSSHRHLTQPSHHKSSKIKDHQIESNQTYSYSHVRHGYKHLPEHGLVVGQEHLALLYPHRKSLCPPKVSKPKLFIEIDSYLMGSFAPLSSCRSGC